MMNLIAELQLPSDPRRVIIALNRVENSWSLDLQRSLSSTGDIHEHFLDLSLRVATITRPETARLRSKIANHFAPSSEEWNGLGRRYKLLLCNGRFWEAQGILGYLFSYSSLEDLEEKKHLLLEYCKSAESVGLSQNEIKMALSYLVSTMLQLGPVVKDLNPFKGACLESIYCYLPASAIHLAVIYGRLDDLQLLLNEGDDPKASNSDDPTPLHFAADEGDVEIIRILIANGASSNNQDSNGRLPLHLAARNGHAEAVMVLIDHGSLLNLMDKYRRTPLSLAAQGGHSTIVEIFLNQHSAKPFINEREFGELSRVAANHGHVKGVQSLIIAAMNLNDDTSEYDKSSGYAKAAPKAKRYIITDRERPHTCIFARYGCTARYGCKNQWKRHVSLQHPLPGLWRCDLRACVPQISSQPRKSSSTIPIKSEEYISHGNEFRSKDLFTQHVRSMHGPKKIASRKERIDFISTLEPIRARCWRPLHDLPPRSLCGFCLHAEGREMVLEGRNGWEERMEHVAEHLERGDTEENEDIGLRICMIREELLSWDNEEGWWKVQGATTTNKKSYE